MKGKLSLTKVVILLIASWFFALAGMYYDKLILTMGIFVLFLVSILLIKVKED